ncbi:MAG: radical SAM protein [Candidatus Sumerlaeia bacterium]|nr:radical SAM protein [Candidatus Sumerlaeia bacterium]
MQRLGLEQRYVYGPVRSRRLGWSLGVNISPTAVKHCSFGCIYCERGLTRVFYGSPQDRPEYMPPTSEILEEIRTGLERERAAGRQLDAITFAGNGEPTDHPDFGEITVETRRLRDQLMPRARMALLSNARHVQSARIRDVISQFDIRCLKLDAGEESLWRRIDVPFGVTLDEVVAGIAKISGVTIQSMFITGKVDNATEAAVGALIERLRFIRPIEIQVYTLDREPPLSGVRPVDGERLREIAARIQRETGTPAIAYGGE